MECWSNVAGCSYEGEVFHELRFKDLEIQRFEI